MILFLLHRVEKILSLQVFGEVAEGLDTLTRINEAYADEKSRPYKNIRFDIHLLQYDIPAQ